MDTTSTKVSSEDIIRHPKSTGPNDEGQNLEMEEEEVLPLIMDYLTPRMMHELKYALNETEESKEKSLIALKDLIAKEKNLVSRTDENFLLQFLRARKHDVKKAFKLLQNYYKFRKEFDTIFVHSKEVADKVREVIFRNYLGTLTHRDRNGCVVFIVKIGMWDPEVDSFEDVFRAITGCLIYANEFPPTQVTGYSAIFDLRNLSWEQMKFCTPHTIFLLIRSTQYCFPSRYKEIHILTENRFFNSVWSIAYPFLTSKLKKRVHLYGKDLSGLLKYFHPSVLPVEFGGEHDPFDNACWKPSLYAEEENVKEWLKYGYK